MIRRSTWQRLFIGAIAAIAAQAAWAQSTDFALLSRTQAEQVGLARGWYGQVPLDSSRAKIKHIKLEAGLLLVVTTDGMLHVFDAESGQLQWSFQVGRRILDTLSASANDLHVAVANMAKVFVLDRANGNTVLERELSGTPERGPVLSEHHVITPLVMGSLEAYSLLDKPEDILGPQFLPSAGRLIGDPAGGDLGVAWTGDLNTIHGHQFTDSGRDFSTPVSGNASTGPTVFWPHVFIGTKAGYLIAYDEEGNEEWRYSTGSEIRQKPVALGPVVYVLPDEGGMYAIDSKSGQPLWFAQDPVQFLSASPQRVYTFDKFGRIVILDAKTGARVDVLRLPKPMKALVNDRSDRLLLYSDSGSIQSLHEQQLARPYIYVRPKPEIKEKGSHAKPKPAATPAPAAVTPEPAPQAEAAAAGN